ncbi:hypothetical protein B0H11DRAFT_833062 [Mycena galericulata]|nr:hypothetical protein B0H11DRAFT_833062 [Mycena galericulata]
MADNPTPLVRTEPSSPVTSAPKLSAFPPLKESNGTGGGTISLFSHRKKIGVQAPSVVPSTSSATGSSVANTCPVTIVGAPNPNETSSETTIQGSQNINNDPSSAASDAPFDVDFFMANVGNGTEDPASRTLPTAAPAPSARRPMRTQTEKSFTSKTASSSAAKGKKSTVSAMDGVPKFFTEDDLLVYNHVGLSPPADDSAPKFRDRTTQNEVKLVTYVGSLERTISGLKKDTGGRLVEFGQLLREVKAATDKRVSIGNDPLFIDVHNAVAENRKSIQGLLDAMPATDFFEVLQTVPAALTTMRDEFESLKLMLTEASSAPGVASTSAFLTPSAVTVSNALVPSGALTAAGAAGVSQAAQPTGHAAFSQLTFPSGNRYQLISNGVNTTVGLAAPTHAQSGTGDQHTSFVPLSVPSEKRTVQNANTGKTKNHQRDNFSGSIRPNKRARVDDGTAFAGHDVIFGPVGPRGIHSVADMSRAAIQMVMQAGSKAGELLTVAANDVISTQVVRGRDDLLSIRFRNREKAEIFIGLVQRYPPIANQHASFRVASGSNAPAEDEETLLEILGGGVQQTR